GLGTRICRMDVVSGEMAPLSPTSEAEQAAEYREGHARLLEDGRAVLAVVRSTGEQPWEVWAGSGDGGVTELRQVSSHQEHLAGITFGSQEAFRWKIGRA